MSAKSSTSQKAQEKRGRRSRALLVASEENAAAAQLCESGGPRVKLARNAFDASGELATSPAHEPIEVIVLAESAAQVSDDPVGALRRIDPAVRIYLVKEGGASAANGHAAAREKSFDGVLDSWPSAQSLMKMLSGEPANGAASTVSKEHAAPKAERAAQAAGEREQRPLQSSAPAPAGQLGDIDLVEAVLGSSDSQPLLEMALQLIRQHTRWNDLTFIDREAHSGEHPALPATEGDAHAAPVRHAGVELGALRSPSAPPAELARWAEWLAPWLALDQQHRRLRECAERDELTGAYNRRYFMTFLAEAAKHASRKRLPIAVMVFDIDDFKQYNDQFGHAAGDEILRETVRLLNSVIRKSDRVCRIGGDEFAVIFTDPGGPRERGSAPPETAEVLAQRFQNQVCQMRFPKLGIEAPGTLSVSAGLATFPWDGWEPEALLEHADALALQSKRKGKNALTLGRQAQRCQPGEELL